MENPMAGSGSDAQDAGEDGVQHSLGHQIVEQVVEQVGGQVLGCSPNLICFGEGTFKERYIRQDPCLSICYLPKEDYTHYTQWQRALVMIAGLCLFLCGISISEVLDATGMEGDDSSYKAGGNCTWALLQEKKGCSATLTYDVIACDVPPNQGPECEDVRLAECSEWMHYSIDRSLFDPDGACVMPFGGARHGALCKCNTTQETIRDLEMCQDAATHQSDCSNVIIFGESGTGPICRCLIQIETWSDAKVADGVKIAEQCDFVEPENGTSSSVYQRSCTQRDASIGDQFFMVVAGTIWHYVLEVLTGVTVFRCMRKRVAQRSKNGVHVPDTGCCMKCVKCWTCCSSGVLGLLFFSFSAVYYYSAQGLLIKVAMNYVIIEAIETFVSNAVGVADYMIAGECCFG
jgi:hypothetical protein